MIRLIPCIYGLYLQVDYIIVYCTVQFYTYSSFYIFIDTIDSDSDAETGLQLEEMPPSTQAEFISENPQTTQVAEPLILSSTGMNILVSIRSML